RARLDDVGDEDVLAPEPGRVEQLVEQLARAADEPQSLLVLAGARRLPDEHHVRVGVALARHDVGRVLTDLITAAGMPAYLLVKGVQRQRETHARHATRVHSAAWCCAVPADLPGTRRFAT